MDRTATQTCGMEALLSAGDGPVSVEMSVEAIAARVREVGRVSDLAPARRLDAKIDLFRGRHRPPHPHGLRAA
ncbi:MAG: hypothetical protein NDJ94_16095 [Vicinamibacteria bacterium]|nr:hypothetical protein [Vicinamibacteria bacterium]